MFNKVTEPNAGPSRSEMEKQRSLYHIPSLRARVSRNVLEGGNYGPFRRGFLSRVARRLRPLPPVKVERQPDGLAPRFLYASGIVEDEQVFAPAELVTIVPKADDHSIVYSDMPYEVRVMGMFSKSYDRHDNSNELVLYSVQTDPNHPDEGQTLPTIHFDHSRDSSTGSDRPNTYIQVPASKSYVTGDSGKRAKLPVTSKSTSEISRPVKRSLNIQFRLLEIDDPSKSVSDAVLGINNLGGVMSGLGKAVPFLGVLNPAMSMLSTMSQRALDCHARPDKILNIDMDFKLASRERVSRGHVQPGEYLRYGYYFFLAEPVEGKLFASVRTPGNLALMLKRCEETTDRKSQIEARPYFPLTDVSYIVVRVTEPTESKRTNTRPIQMNHARVLQQIFKRSKPGEDEPSNISNSLYSLGVELGVFDSESDQDSNRTQ